MWYFKQISFWVFLSLWTLQHGMYSRFDNLSEVILVSHLWGIIVILLLSECQTTKWHGSSCPSQGSSCHSTTCDNNATCLASCSIVLTDLHLHSTKWIWTQTSARKASLESHCWITWSNVWFVISYFINDNTGKGRNCCSVMGLYKKLMQYINARIYRERFGAHFSLHNLFSHRTGKGN